MAEYIISLVIFCMVAFILIGIGVIQIKSEKPVGFYTGQKPPEEEQLTDVRLWNKKHGVMWIMYGIAIIGSFLVGIFAGDTIYAVIVMFIVIFGGLLPMIWYHGRLKKMYLI